MFFVVLPLLGKFNGGATLLTELAYQATQIQFGFGNVNCFFGSSELNSLSVLFITIVLCGG